MANRAPDTLAPAATWARCAACLDDDPEKYFDERYLPSNLACGSCPVAAQCLDEAMRAEGTTAASMRFGVYGGLTTKQRAELAQQRVRPAAAAGPAVRTSPHGIAPTEPCGTRAAYRRHHRRNETPCAAYKAAERLARAGRKARRGAVA